MWQKQHTNSCVHICLIQVVVCSIASFESEELGVAVDDADVPMHIRDRMASAAKQADVAAQTQDTLGKLASTAALEPQATAEQVCMI